MVLAGEKVLDLGPWLIVGAIIGARTLYVITFWKEQFAGEPIWEVFMVQKGGLVYYGGLIGASLACILYARIRKLGLWKLADVLAPSIALGYVFGRIGCLMNGCCYGRACDLPWHVTYPAGHPTHPPAGGDASSSDANLRVIAQSFVGTAFWRGYIGARNLTGRYSPLTWSAMQSCDRLWKCFGRLSRVSALPRRLGNAGSVCEHRDSLGPDWLCFGCCIGKGAILNYPGHKRDDAIRRAKVRSDSFGGSNGGWQIRVGSTACGKNWWGIVSVDSMQVYRGLDIGTAKPTRDERARVRHHLIDVVDVTEPFVGEFRAIGARGGGGHSRSRAYTYFVWRTGLYFKAFLDGLGDAPKGDAMLRVELENTPLADLLAELAAKDPATYEKMDRQNARRVIRARGDAIDGQIDLQQRANWLPPRDEGGRGATGTTLFIGLTRAAADLQERINMRVEKMFRDGLVAETESLLKRRFGRKPDGDASAWVSASGGASAGGAFVARNN